MDYSQYNGLFSESSTKCKLDEPQVPLRLSFDIDSYSSPFLDLYHLLSSNFGSDLGLLPKVMHLGALTIDRVSQVVDLELDNQRVPEVHNGITFLAPSVITKVSLVVMCYQL